jgi:hypothetical protein
MYQHIDDHLRKFCQSERDMPTEEEANEAINVYPLPDYYTDVGAKLDMANSIERLYRYRAIKDQDIFLLGSVKILRQQPVLSTYLYLYYNKIRSHTLRSPCI